MAKIIAFIFVAVAILHANGQEDEIPSCPKNAHYSYCAAPKPTTCASQYIATFMTMNCIERCDCDAGYVFSNDGERCMHPIDCKPEEIQCYEAQTYSTTGNQLICDEVTDMSILKPGCYCPNGLFFDRFASKCVAKEDCTKPFIWSIMGGGVHPIDMNNMEWNEYDIMDVIETGVAEVEEEQATEEVHSGTEQLKESEQPTDVESKVVEETKEVEETKVADEPKVVEEPKEVKEGGNEVVEKPNPEEAHKVEGVVILP